MSLINCRSPNPDQSLSRTWPVLLGFGTVYSNHVAGYQLLDIYSLSAINSAFLHSTDDDEINPL